MHCVLVLYRTGLQVSGPEYEELLQQVAANNWELSITRKQRGLLQ